MRSIRHTVEGWSCISAFARGMSLRLLRYGYSLSGLEMARAEWKLVYAGAEPAGAVRSRWTSGADLRVPGMSSRLPHPYATQQF
jgi:hypothetical protein